MKTNLDQYRLLTELKSAPIISFLNHFRKDAEKLVIQIPE